MSRRQEIEAKKQRLAELRRLREDKTREATGRDQSVQSVDSVVVVDNIDSGDVQVEKKYSDFGVQTEPVEKESSKQAVRYSKATQTVDLGELWEGDKGVDVDVDVDTEEDVEDKEQVVVEDKEDTPVSHETLSAFLQHSFHTINRVIADDQAIFENYTKSKQHAVESSTNYVLYQQLTTDSKTVYSIATSPHSADLLLISTGNIVYLYNLKIQKFEMEFYSQTRIINVQFATFDQNLIFATGYNGKIVIWDLRQKKSLKNFPVLESSVSMDTHSYPVWVLLQLHTDQDVLLTASTDGKLLLWDSKILKRPTMEPILLKIPKNLNLIYDELTPLCAARLKTGNKPTKRSKQSQQVLLLGAEDGNIYKLNPNFEYINKLGSKSSSSENELIETVYQGHEGPVLQLDAHEEYHNLFLSCSMDWKVYLWDINQQTTPRLTIYKTDSIMDCHWRPLNASQFGYIFEDVFELIDLNVNSVNPVVKIQIKSKLLNKFQFDKNGQFVIISDITGVLYNYELLLPAAKDDNGVFKRKYVQSV